jgi:hypothetical protein
MINMLPEVRWSKPHAQRLCRAVGRGAGSRALEIDADPPGCAENMGSTLDDARFATARKTLSRRDFLRLGGVTLTASIAGYALGFAFVGGEPTVRGRQGGLAKLEPNDGLAYTGVSLTRPPDFCVKKAVRRWDAWTALMGGKPAAISHEYTWFDRDGEYGYRFARARNAIPMISIEFTNASTPAIANAGTTWAGSRTDRCILTHAYSVREYQDDVFVRLGHEMNGYWYTYCAYNEDGTLRTNTSEDYKQAWRRFVTIFRGGYVGDIDARLHDLGMPPLDRQAVLPDHMGYGKLDDPHTYLRPVDNASFVWCPNDSSNPNVVGNGPSEYYPGDEFVDWVGQDVYHAPWWTAMDAHFDSMDDFYREFSEWRGKPYMLAEWALMPPNMGPQGTTTNNDSAFIDRVLEWTDSHARAKALVYWSWLYPPQGDYRLQNFPKAAQALAAGWKVPRFLGGGEPVALGNLECGQ